ncbi:hypothetical protein UPYG_G00351470 [Umbra pygmaea]|uniref:Lung adenoma susceptibility protein 2 n=1 Tax=Umbra pygmaea TaxID=75934 RepID=A0ABD0WHR5_UMBPY
MNSSPESTVTTLFARSGHLRSSLWEPDQSESLTGIKYADRDYESATEALDAYIADFEKSRHVPETSTGRLQVQKGRISHDNQPRTGFRNRDVLRDSLTDRELDLLNLPVGVIRRGDPESLSLTTDDLLVQPCDGSLPVTRTSAYLTQSGSYRPGCNSLKSSLCSAERPWLNRSHHVKPRLHRSHHKFPRDSRGEGRPGRTQRLVSSTGFNVQGNLPPHHSLYHQTPSPKDTPGLSSHQGYPRWLTSHRSNMDFSGITSIPDMTYPAWLQEVDDIPKDIPTIGQDVSQKTHPCRTQTRPLPPQTPPSSSRIPSWLSELEASYEQTEEVQDSDGGRFEPFFSSGCKQLPDHQNLRELRLHFAESLTVAALGERTSNFHHLLRDDKIETLTLKAENALNCQFLDLNNQRQNITGNSLGGSEDILEADRSWDNPAFTFKSPVPVGGAEDPLILTETHQGEAASGSCSSGYSSRKHPGPVEALKQMLFSLQALERQVTPDNGTTEQEVLLKDTLTPCQTPTMDNSSKKAADDSNIQIKMPETQVEDIETCSGGQSLQRALRHLVRLKSLVEDSPGKKTLRNIKDS